MSEELDFIDFSGESFAALKFNIWKTKTLKTHEKQPKIADKLADNKIWPKIRRVHKSWTLKHSLLRWSWKLKNHKKAPKIAEK
jgi:hypothetical protein